MILENQNKKAFISRLFSNPIIGATGALAGIISIPLAIYLYHQTLKYREFVYFVNPIKTSVVNTGYTSNIKVLFNNKEILKNVTAVQLIIWNQGKESIKKDNILNPIKLITDPPTPILEAIIQKSSREVIGCNLENSFLNKGIVEISWKILEFSDGFTLQLIYAGDTNVKLLLNGTIEGQGSPKEIRNYESLWPGNPAESIRSYYNFIIIMSLIILLMASVSIYMTIKKERYHIFKNRGVIFVLFGNILIMVVFLIFILFNRPIEPPFGF